MTPSFPESLFVGLLATGPQIGCGTPSPLSEVNARSSYLDRPIDQQRWTTGTGISGYGTSRAEPLVQPRLVEVEGVSTTIAADDIPHMEVLTAEAASPADPRRFQTR